MIAEGTHVRMTLQGIKKWGDQQRECEYGVLTMIEPEDDDYDYMNNDSYDFIYDVYWVDRNDDASDWYSYREGDVEPIRTAIIVGNELILEDV